MMMVVVAKVMMGAKSVPQVYYTSNMSIINQYTFIILYESVYTVYSISYHHHRLPVARNGHRGSL